MSPGIPRRHYTDDFKAHASSAFASRPAVEIVGRHQAGNPIQTRCFTSVTHAQGPDGLFAVFVYLTNALQ